MLGGTHEDHNLGVEIVDAYRCKGIWVQFCLPDEGEVVIYHPDFRFIPELTLQKRTRHDEHEQTGRVEHPVGFVGVIKLGRRAVKIEVERRVPDYDVEFDFGVVRTDVGGFDICLRV